MKERGIFWSPRLDVIDAELKRRRHEQRARTEEPPAKPWGDQETLRPAMEMPRPVGRLPLRQAKAPMARYSVEPVAEDEALPSTQEVEEVLSTKEKEEEDMAEQNATAVAEQRLEEAKQEVTNLEGQIAQEQAVADDERREAALNEAVVAHAEASADYTGMRETLVDRMEEMSKIATSMVALRDTIRRSVSTAMKNGGSVEASLTPRFFGDEGQERDVITRTRTAIQSLTGRA